MASSQFEPLANRLNVLPDLLVGPILRRVTAKSVTVFFAFKSSCLVTLEVSDPAIPNHLNLLILTGTASTVAIGTNFHVLAITAKPLSSQPDVQLESGTVYAYTAAFDFGGSRKELLHDLGLDLGYGQSTLPTFSLPPDNLAKLRIFYGSCRKPHMNGRDALEGLHSAIATSASNAYGRPHMMIHGGDQIYADDVADILLEMLMDAAQTLLSNWTGMSRIDANGRTVTLTENLILSNPVTSLSPGSRQYYLTKEAGLTSTAARSHLVTLGEYMMMYAFVWSDVLWPPSFSVPAIVEVEVLDPQNDIPAGYVENAEPLKMQVENPDYPLEEVNNSKYVNHFIGTNRKRIKNIRKAMANVPNYMMFDDHEVTDDWNLHRSWTEKVLVKPLGRRILANGLSAYAIFQAWGNTPDRFEGTEPGRKLLNEIVAWKGKKDSAHTDRIEKLVGLSVAEKVRAEKALPINDFSKAIRWDFALNFDKFQLLMVDTRTMREFPGKDAKAPPSLLSNAAIALQVTAATRQSGQEITILGSAVPLLFWNALEYGQKVAGSVFDRKYADMFDVEGWTFQTESFERFLSALILRPPVPLTGTGSSAKAKDRIVILSGDVHVGFTMRMGYWADHIFPDSASESAPGGVEAVLVQCTSSGLNNTDKMFLHNEGLGSKALKVLFDESGFGEERGTIKHVGWQVRSGRAVDVHLYSHHIAVPSGYAVQVKVKLSDPVTVKSDRNTYGFSPLVAPDWSHRVDLIPGIPIGNRSRPVSDLNVTVPTGSKESSVEQYLKLADEHKDFLKIGRGNTFVGRNNLGEVGFVWTDQLKLVQHKLWWSMRSRSKWFEPLPLTEYSVDLSYGDSAFPKPPSAVTP